MRDHGFGARGAGFGLRRAERSAISAALSALIASGRMSDRIGTSVIQSQSRAAVTPSRNG